VLVLVLAAAPALGGAAFAQRLTARELGFGAVAATGRRTFVGGELGVGLRPGGQSRFAVAVAAGGEAARAALRAQATLQFLVTPAARRGVGPYAGFGAAFSARRGSPSQGFVAVLIGIEGGPGRRTGWGNWYIECGMGGGVRAAAGWRLRSFPAWWSGR
jgi:hypothetical protein